MAKENRNTRPLRFAGFVCFWRTARREGESNRQRFFSIYGNLKQAIEERTASPVSDRGNRGWRLVRISEPGRRFLGIAGR